MTAPILADRVCKARRQSTCPLCRGPVQIGQQIARIGPGCWVHSGCHIAEIKIRNEGDTVTNPPRTDVGNAIRGTLMSPNEADSNFEPANVVDGLFAIARAIDRLADTIQDPATARQLGHQLLDAGRTEGTG